ncbi:MAG: S16 family serine protease [Verrucomicrobiota bacterium]
MTFCLTPKNLWIVLLHLSLAFGISLAQDQNSLPKTAFYYYPHKTSLFEAAAIDPTTTEPLVESLTLLARNTDVSLEARVRMVALGLMLAPSNEDLALANTHLKSAEFAPLLETPSDIDTAVNRLSTIAEELGRKSDDAHKALAAALTEICFSISPSDPSIAYSHHLSTRQFGLTPWHNVLAPSDVPMIKKAEKGAVYMDNTLTGLTPKIRQSGINGLLISELASGQMAGKASRMSATYLTRNSEANLSEEQKATRLRFNQEVGEDMANSLTDISGLIDARHGENIETGVVEFAFQDKYIMKDGDSAGLACGLLSESLITGNPINSKFTCTGAIRANGDVKAIGGVLAKLRGAQKFGSEVVVVPLENKAALTDMVLLGQAADIVKMQVFTAATFDEAWQLARLDRSEDITQTLDEFTKLQAQFTRTDVLSVARLPENQELLKRVLEKMPNHASAELLLKSTQGDIDRVLSFNGSVEEFMSELTNMFQYMEVVRRTPLIVKSHRRSDAAAQETSERIRKVSLLSDTKTKALGSALQLLNERMIALDRSRTERTTPQMLELSSAVRLVFEELEHLSEDPELLETVDEDNVINEEEN